MMLGSEEIVEHLEAPADPDKLAVYPLASLCRDGREPFS
jgi:multiple antibiotic resistance protein